VLRRTSLVELEVWRAKDSLDAAKQDTKEVRWADVRGEEE
jgi:hypothetical protein